MTDLERSLHDVLHSLSGAMKAAEEEKKGVEGQDLPLYMFYHSVRVDLGEIQGRVGKLLRIIEDNNGKEGKE